MIREKLMKIQTEIKAPKDLKNTFGNYNYRNAEQICEALKPLLAKYNCCLVMSDEVQMIENGYVYVKATATLYDCDDDTTVSATALARESYEKKGMDASQITGSASSYARKYCLSGLLLLDDTKDQDTDESKIESNNKDEDQKKNGERRTTNKTSSDKVKVSTLKKLRTVAKATGHTEDQIKEYFKVEKLADLSEKAANSMIAKWEIK